MGEGFFDGFSAERTTLWAYFHLPSFQTRVTSVIAKLTSENKPTRWSSQQKIRRQTPSPIDLGKSYIQYKCWFDMMMMMRMTIFYHCKNIVTLILSALSFPPVRQRTAPIGSRPDLAPQSSCRGRLRCSCRCGMLGRGPRRGSTCGVAHCYIIFSVLWIVNHRS